MSTPGGSRFTPQNFTAQNQSTEQRLSTNVVGLVHLSDFRKRRAEVLEQQEREAREAATTKARTKAAVVEAKVNEVNEATVRAQMRQTATPPRTASRKRKGQRQGTARKRKGGKISKLSFLGDEDDDAEEEAKPSEKAKDAKSATPASVSPSPSPSDVPGPPPIKSFTQQALRRQAAEREALRKEFLAMQAAVKATEIAIPFVFYEGANIPGGIVRVKKGDFVWLFLDRSRKVGARLGVGEKRLSKARLHWARINVDDLMLVRGNLIIPHHYDFYFFLINKTIGPGGLRVFDYSSEMPAASDTADKTPKAAVPLSTPGAGKKGEGDDTAEPDYSHLEGAGDDPGLTKVVDRRWYERNKHIYPASLWQEFDPEEDYTQQVRRDHGGNVFFFAPK